VTARTLRSEVCARLYGVAATAFEKGEPPTASEAQLFDAVCVRVRGWVARCVSGEGGHAPDVFRCWWVSDTGPRP
jgi:hypothetical protein